MNYFERLFATAQALVASRTVKLAPEPPGERSGIVGNGLGTPLRLVAVGDSLIAGCGTDQQSTSLTPLLASKISAIEQRPVQWATHSQLGATMRRVRYKYLPLIKDRPDILFVCAGSNDVMARRTASEWTEDLRGTLDQAQNLADRVVLCSAGQPHYSPALPNTLKKALAIRIDEQTAISVHLCQERGIAFANVAHAVCPADFWADDGFHPGTAGYVFAAKLIAQAMYPDWK